MNFRIMALLPQLFRTGNLIIKSLEGGLDANELRAIIKELRDLVESIPELKGFLGLFDVVVKVAAVVLPTFLGDKAKLLALGLKEEEVQQAVAVTTMFQQLINETIAEGQAAQDKVTLDDIEDLT